MTRLTRILCCLVALLCLCSCSVMEQLPPALQASQPASAADLPDLRQLRMPEPEPDLWQPAKTGEGSDTLLLDLWLDASQVAGGVNPNPDSIYPHRSGRYREGGFHYRYGSQVGWYDNLLKALLAAGEGSRIRVLRSGNEAITDEMLLASGLAAAESDAAALRSLRRDLLTYAIDPMPTVFDSFSDQSMDNSFYALYTPKLNRMSQFMATGGMLLENPGRVEEMYELLDSMIQSYDPRHFDETAAALLTPERSPLTTALDNLDTDRLSVITCDPLTLRSLTGILTDGTPISYVEELLRQRGIFDKGLTVQLYAFQLDYIGQIHTLNGADLRHPLIWGRLDYDYNQKKTYGPLPMPRTLLMLVIGAEEQVDDYTRQLESCLAADPALQELRGPQEGQLRYTRAGQAVTQEPFGFGYESTRISRHSVNRYTLLTPGATAQVTAGEGALLSGRSLPTVGLALDEEEQYEITLSFPVGEMDGGLTMSAASLPPLEVSGVCSLVLAETLPNTPEAAPSAQGGQTLLLRDTLYRFAMTQQPEALPFAPAGLKLADGMLTAAFTASGKDLRPGYYRLILRADVTGQQLAWPPVDWVERLNANVTNQQLSSWLSVGEALQKRHKTGGSAPNLFWHAWGDKPGHEYYGVTLPDCPPVYAAPRLKELLSQLQNAAQIDTLPLVYAQLDVFVAPAEQLN